MSRIVLSVPDASRYPGKHPSPVPRETQRLAPRARVPAPTPPGRRALVAQTHPRLRVAIEHALLGEGYELVDGPWAASGAPVLLFAGAGDGLHVLKARDVAAALEGLSGGPGALHGSSLAPGIHAFVPRPFGVADVLRVARAVNGFDCRRRAPEP